MRLDVLRYLADIDETHSISATAERFFIAQPAVSNAIMNLEKSMGVKLLKRSTHGAMPTEEGKKVIAAAKNILTQWDEVNKCIKNEGYEPTETIENLPINILCGSGLTNIVIPKMLEIVDKKYPYVDITLEHTDSLKYFGKKIYDSKFDIYLVSLNKEYFMSLIPQINEENMNIVKLADDHLGVCMSSKFIYADKNDFDVKKGENIKGCSFGFLPILSTKIGSALNFEKSDLHRDFYGKINYSGLLAYCQDVDFYKRILNQNTILTLPFLTYEAYFKGKRFQYKEFSEYDKRIHEIIHVIVYRDKAGREVKDIVAIMQECFRTK